MTCSVFVETAVTVVATLAQETPGEVGRLLGGSLAEDDSLFVRGLLRFGEGGLLLRLALDIGLALALASTIAFHPRRHGRAVNLDEVEYPKTVLLYAVVGTIVAEIVVVSPAMALVVFGIGGLLRFRTDVGAAHDTGHVILATLVGIACGLGRFPLAVAATAVGWLLIWTLERGAFYRLVVEKVDRRSVEPSIAAYQELLRSEGWSIRGIKREPGKERFSIYVRGREPPEPGPVEDRLGLAPEELRGAPYWEGI
jgi:hypothetical protein